MTASSYLLEERLYTPNFSSCSHLEVQAEVTLYYLILFIRIRDHKAAIEIYEEILKDKKGVQHTWILH